MKKFVALAVLSLTLAAGCTGQPDPEPDESPSPSVVPSPSSSPSVELSPSPESSPSPSIFESLPPVEPGTSEEHLAIRDGLIRYWNAVDKFAADRSLTDLTETQTVSTGEAARVVLSEIQKLREGNWVAVGGRSFHDISVDDPTTTSDGTVLAQIHYCSDRSAVKILDAETGRDTGQYPIPYVRSTATMVKGADGLWRVSSIRDEEAPSCA